MQLADLVAGVESGQRRAIGRLITLLESDHPDGQAALRRLQPRLGRAHVVGVTGAPGTGKSTLVDRLAAEARRRGQRVGIVAVDPSSPFTGGAILGDRIRMGGHANDRGVFIRSMGSRGALGGLSSHTLEAVQALDAAGFDLVLVETVGVGQAEVDIARLADTVLLVLVPNLGDDVQAVKAGIMEIADAFVVNKADLAGSDKVAAEVEASLMLAHPAAPPDGGEPWTPPIVRAIAEKGDGVAAVLDTVAAHKAWSQAGGAWERRRRARLAAEVRAHLQRAVWERAFTRDGAFRPAYAALERRLAHGEVSAREAAALLLAGPPAAPAA